MPSKSSLAIYALETGVADNGITKMICQYEGCSNAAREEYDHKYCGRHKVVYYLEKIEALEKQVKAQKPTPEPTRPDLNTLAMWAVGAFLLGLLIGGTVL